MKMAMPNQRWLVLGSLLLVTLLSVFLVGEEDSEIVQPESEHRGQKPLKKTDARARQTGESGVDQQLISQWFEKKTAEPLPEQVLAAGALDPFRKKSWYIPPPPPPPPKPTAPPLSFQFLGRLQGDGDGRVFLLHQGKNLIIKQGDVIANTYRVEEVLDNRIVFVYLPLNEKQILTLPR